LGLASSHSLEMNTGLILESVGVAVPLDHVNRRPCSYSSLISNSSSTALKLERASIDSLIALVVGPVDQVEVNHEDPARGSGGLALPELLQVMLFSGRVLGSVYPGYCPSGIVCGACDGSRHGEILCYHLGHDVVDSGTCKEDFASCSLRWKNCEILRELLAKKTGHGWCIYVL
jgi:hypothetical protein